MMDQFTDELRTRMHETADTVGPTNQLVDVAKLRYRRRRTGGAVLAAGAAVAVFAAAVSVPALLNDRGPDRAGIAVADPAVRPTAQPPVAQPTEVTFVTFVTSGLRFTLPSGYLLKRIAGPTRTTLGPDEPDVNDLAGHSEVASAVNEADGSELSLALYDGEVGAGGNAAMSQPGAFGQDPHVRTTIAGHDAWVSTVTQAPRSTCLQTKPGRPARVEQELTGLACAAPFPHVTIRAQVSPSVHLYYSSSGVSEADAIAVVESGLT